MGIKADITLMGGVEVTGAYLRITQQCIRTVTAVVDDVLEKKHVVEYRAEAYLNQKARESGAQPLRYDVPGLGGNPMTGDGMAEYDPETDANIWVASYRHLSGMKALEAVSAAI